MSEKVEAVARAMWESEPIIYGWSHSERKKHGTWDAAVKNDCYGVPVYRAFARAAIEAMREPTDAMVVSGAKQLGEAVQWDRLGELPREYLRIDARAVYDAMIDEALK